MTIRATSASAAVLLGIAIASWPWLARATVCSPTHLVHIVTTNVTPGVQPGSFNAQPRVLYRQGSDKSRVEEAFDTVNNIHGLIVVSEPDIWMVNLADGTGKHIVDPGPTFNSRTPVFAFTDVDPKLLGLEFGCEAEFIAANAPKSVRVESIGDARFDVYRVQSSADIVEILDRVGTTIPAFARYYRNGKVLMAWRYDAYETMLPLNPQLFTRPSGVKYVEANTSR